MGLHNRLSYETAGYAPDYITQDSLLRDSNDSLISCARGVSWLLKSTSCPFQDVMNALRKSCRSNFDQIVAQREVGFFMDVLENERFFKRDFSRRTAHYSRNGKAVCGICRARTA